MQQVEIGIIGGSGLYQLNNVKMIEEVSLDTPFGKPSGSYLIGELRGKKIAFLARHGKNHTILPTELNARANVYGFKMLGVRYLIGVSAVGSLREEIEPAHIVFPSQIIDRTRGRSSTFFGDGIVAHIGFADPFCSKMTEIFKDAAEELQIKYHTDKTYVCMEGPAFSTRAESEFHRQIGGDVIGMTAAPEAKLAREAEMSYGIIALSTDYDCWWEEEEAVTVDMVVATMKKNSETAKSLLEKIIPKLDYNDSEAFNVLDFSIMTGKDNWPNNTVNKINCILKRFL